MRTGIANLPLHPGHCPKWLFPRMKAMSAAITEAIVYEYGQEEFLKRLADPYWFQAFGCVLGFDWHSSGLTTTTMGALKEGLNEKELGIRIAGGKGGTSRKAPAEIEAFGREFELDFDELVHASKMAAKVDSAAVQDGYQLYHHCFVFTEEGNWAVVQQGLNNENKYARRYHWLSTENFVNEPHSAICCDEKGNDVLNMTAKISEETRKISVDIVQDVADFGLFMKRQTTLAEFETGIKKLTMHSVHTFTLNKRSIDSLKKVHEIRPESYEELLALKGIGPKAVRALALISELVYGKEPSWEDPARYSFAHGGKDGIPYPVNREMMDKNTRLLKTAIEDAKIGNKEKMFALKRLSSFCF